MPGGKYRLKALLTGGLKVGQGGSAGTDVSNILAGSAAVTIPCAVAGSSGGVYPVTITGLTACHVLIANLEGTSGCFGVVGACPGTDSASFAVANWSGSEAPSTAGKVRYIAMRVRQ